MTRLVADDIAAIAGGLREYDADLIGKTGLSLKELAIRAAGLDSQTAEDRVSSHRVGVVTMTCGDGAIEGFSQSLLSIATHVGFPAFIAETTDAAGWAEAVERGADIVLTADDDRFVAVNMKAGRVGDNSEATGRGFAHALDAMAGGLRGGAALVLGCGPVGRSAGRAFFELGAEVEIYDIRPEVSREWVRKNAAIFEKRVRAGSDLSDCLNRHRYILDATPIGGVIDDDFIRPDTMLAMPGVPCGVSLSVLEKHWKNIIHDPLQIGTATMLMMAL